MNGDSYVEPLSSEDIELWQSLEDEVGAEAFLTRIPQVSGIDKNKGRPFLVPWHVHPLAEVAASIRRGERRRVLVGMPPRMSKTETLLNIPPWLWERRPLDVIYATYAGDLARSKSIRAQEIARATGWKVSGTKGEWSVQNGGSFRATGVGGQLTGHGANLLIVDDPFRDREEAESPLMRQKIYDWFTDTALTRLMPDGSVIVLHHRWHDDDLIGRLLETGAWEHIKLPAITQTGESLWPEYWPLQSLLDIKKDGPYKWASLYMQEPQPRGGRLFGTEPGRYNWPSNVEHARFILAACDPAATTDTHNDKSAITIGAFYLVQAPGQTPYVICDVLWHWADHVEIPDLALKLKWVSQNWGCPIVVETIGAFKSVAQNLRRIAPGAKVITIDAVKDKFVRSQLAAANWRQGRIRMPSTAEHCPWLHELMQEVRQFTGVGDAHDDRVDSLVHLWNKGYEALCAPRRGLGHSIAAFA